MKGEIKFSFSNMLVGFLLTQKALYPSQQQVLDPEHLAFFFSLLGHTNIKVISVSVR